MHYDDLDLPTPAELATDPSHAELVERAVRERAVRDPETGFMIDPAQAADDGDLPF